MQWRIQGERGGGRFPPMDGKHLKTEILHENAVCDSSPHLERFAPVE